MSSYDNKSINQSSIHYTKTTHDCPAALNKHKDYTNISVISGSVVMKAGHLRTDSSKMSTFLWIEKNW